MNEVNEYKELTYIARHTNAVELDNLQFLQFERRVQEVLLDLFTKRSGSGFNIKINSYEFIHSLK